MTEARNAMVWDGTPECYQDLKRWVGQSKFSADPLFDTCRNPTPPGDPGLDLWSADTLRWVRVPVGATVVRDDRGVLSVGGTGVIVNLTPHPMHVFPPDCPDRIERDAVKPAWVLPACARPPRLGETEIGLPWVVSGVPVVDITFGLGEGLPPPQPGVFLVVSRPVAMVNRDRSDLLVPHEVIRDLDGSTLGCRAFARPV